MRPDAAVQRAGCSGRACDKIARRAKFLFSSRPNHRHGFAHPVPLRGRRPSSRTLDGLRWTLGLRLDDGAVLSVRQNRVVLAPVAGVKLSDKRKRKRQRRSQSRPRLRGDHGISRKATAQGMSDVLRCPVCSCAPFQCKPHTRPRVQRASGIPCALSIS